MDEQAYLDPDFDPSSLTVPQLRSVLVAHSVNYPSSAKKKELIDLFNENVVPQAKKLRAASARVKRTSRGIVDVPSSQNADYDEEIPPPPSTGRRSGGRTARARTEEAQEVPPTARSTRHSTAPPEATPRRSTSNKHARTVEREDVVQEPEPKRPASRKSRQSAVTPVVKSEDEDTSNFSSENVFQAGGSSPIEQHDRRRTTSALKDADRRRSKEVRRRTGEVKPAMQQMDGTVVPTRKTFEMPVSALKKQEPEISEEFTPEETQELVRAQQAGELVPVQPRARRTTSKAARNGVSAVMLAILGGVAALWGQEKFEVGYCGVGQPSREIAGVEIPEWADVVRPECEICPPHAVCNDRLATNCEPGFVLTQHPLSLNGILPIPPTCEPDSARAKRVNSAKESVVAVLRKQNAQYECGSAESPQIREEELKTAFKTRAKQKTKMSNEEFEDLWNSAIGEVRAAEEVSVGVDGSGHDLLRSNSHARFPLSCQIRRHLRATLREYLWQLIGILLLASSGVGGRYYIAATRDEDKRAKELAMMALEKLSNQAALHAYDPNMYREDYLPVPQLRDDVLRSEWSTFRRKKLWEKVQQKVEHNANVRPAVRESSSGDVGRVWQWVGHVGMIESPPSTSGGAAHGHERRKSGRVSFGGEQWIPPRSDTPEMSQVKKWEEGGQYY